VFEIFDGGAEGGVGILSVEEKEFFAENDMKGDRKEGGGDEKIADGGAVKREDEVVGVHYGDNSGGEEEETGPEKMKNGIDGDDGESSDGDEDADVDAEGNGAENAQEYEGGDGDEDECAEDAEKNIDWLATFFTWLATAAILAVLGAALM